MKKLVLRAYGIVGNWEDARDAVSRVYLHLLSDPHLTEKMTRAEFESYAAAAVKNDCKELLRTRNKHWETPLIEEQIGDGPDMDRKMQIQHCLSRLRPGEREILMLRAWEGRSYGEIARRLKISEDAAAKRYARAKARLYEFCVEEGIMG